MAQDADRRFPRLVIVDGVGAASHRWTDGLVEFRPEVVATLGEVGDLCAHDVVIVDLPDLGPTSLASIRASERATPAHRLLTADHHELAAIFQSGDDVLFRFIVPRTGSADNVRALVAGLRTCGDGGAPKDPEADVDRPADWSSTVELLQWTIAEAVRVPGVIIRSFQPRSNRLEVQLVCRLSRGFDRFHCELPRRWGWPARMGDDNGSTAGKGKGKTKVEGNHRSMERFGKVERDQEIYLRPVPNTPDCAYLAVLPWTDDDRVTIAIGLWLDDGEPDRTKDARASAVAELHAQAVREVRQFTLPALDDTTNGVRYLLEYDWVVARTYAGPDRRSQDTSLINRHMFSGRRKTLAKSVDERVGGFVDGVPRWVGSYFFVYAALATIDTFCTSRFVSTGAVVELNPFLAPLIGHHPWLFLLTKNACALLAFGIIVRFHVFRRAKHVLWASVGLYGLLDLYWTILLLGPLAR